LGVDAVWDDVFVLVIGLAATTVGKALVDDDCAKKAVAELTRD